MGDDAASIGLVYTDNMKHIRHQKHRTKKKAFILIELLVVFAVVLILVTVVISAVSTSRAKAEDTKTKEVLGSIRTVATEEKNETGTFETICTTPGKTNTAISTLAAQRNLENGEFTCVASSDEFAVVFPLKSSNNFWCIDAEGNAALVATPAFTGEPYRCDRLPAGNERNNGSNSTPVITLGPSSSDDTPESFPEPSYTAYDAEDGDVTANVTYSDEIYNLFPRSYCSAQAVRRTYRVTDSDGDTGTAERNLRPTYTRDCAAPPMCEFEDRYDNIPQCGEGEVILDS